MKKIFFIIILLLICFTVSARAQTQFKPQISVGGSEFQANVPVDIGGLSIANYIIAFYQWSVRAIAVLAVIMIMVAGFRWVTSAGNAPAISQAKDRMISAVIGLVLAIGANLLLFAINPALTRFKSLSVAPIERKELTTWEFPLPVQRGRWYYPDEEPYAGARKCGNAKLFEESGKKIIRYGTECEGNDQVCDLKFSISEKDYLEWKEGKTDKDISLLIKRDSAECIKVAWGPLCDPPLVGACAQIELASKNGAGLEKYPLVTAGTFTGTREWSCGESVQDTFFIFGKSPTRWETACGGKIQKGCTFVTVKQIYNDNSLNYVSSNACSWYPPSLKSCSLTETRVSCAKCGSPSNCTDGLDEGKICCAEYGAGPYHLR